MAELSVVLATLNEEENIGVLLHALEPHLDGIDAEIIVVDDNSRDRTAAIAEEANRRYGNVRTIVRKNERGLASALLRGFQESSGDYILTMDGDLAHDPKFVPELFRLVKSGEADLAIGSRYVRGSRVVGKPIVKSAASRFGQFVALVWLGTHVKDNTNNFRVFSRALYESIRDELTPSAENIMLVEFVYRASKKGYRIVEIPTSYFERTRGVTKLKLGKMVAAFIKTAWMIRFR
jgi:dolichol-phosphate mannosyltransferase